MNALRLIRQNKRVEIFEAQKHGFVELKSESEWNDFFARCSVEVRQRIEQLSASGSKVTAPVQASLL